ncbi:multidrug ABC transporter permease [Dictyobacter vulcani]|uniref:Multidrug ABC transporter permease n=1 Tax=Dictyobacter vulcani TaxID=2607529 RepID=A0A5J4KPG2_9CHLR|nr:ABC transporter ATP-binding protein [Dictyobacter vulcani]GER88337.1 multidrug ABC transporter permease [Dictyobacter vulcani]
MAATRSSNSKPTKTSEEKFSLAQVFVAFASLPRVFRLVWSASAPMTLILGGLSILRGLTPAVSVSITQVVIDSVIRGIRIHSIAPIWLPVGLQLAVSLVDRVFANANNIVQQLLQDKVLNHTQLMILRKTNTLDLSSFENAEFYDKLQQAATQTNYKPVSMISQTFELMRTTITLVAMLSLLLQLSWWLALVAFILPIPSFIASSKYSWYGYRLMRHEAPERRKMLYINKVMTVDDYNKEIKLFNLGNFFIGRYIGLMTNFYEDGKKILVPRQLNNLLWSSLTVIANSGIYLYVALQAVLGRISLGALSKYTQASIQAGTSFQGILDGVSNVYENALFVNTLFEFLQYVPTIVPPEKPVKVPIQEDSNGLDLEFRDVSFTYPGKTEPTLRHVSFTVRAGESIALVGRNGAGKTTLVKLLTRLYDPDEGEILIGGLNIRNYDFADLRQYVGVIFQDFAKYQMTARENIGIGRVVDIDNLEDVKASASKSGADEVIEGLDEGYESMLGHWFKDGTQLSGGEWQKVALARAFMRDARILILDEPTSALDPQAEYDVFTRFRHLTSGKTAIFISHRFSTVRLADRIFVIEHGDIIESGSHQELMQRDGRYAELFNLQAQAYR